MPNERCADRHHNQEFGENLLYNINGEKGKDANVRLRFDMPEFKVWWPNGWGQNISLGCLSNQIRESYIFQNFFGIRGFTLILSRRVKRKVCG